ncbi:hypothetical protein E8E13_011285 [Curvularia kusanoi]|uniref:Prolyl 4-hydroxylase alpha subunit Fe(2+) 2OG dioxygenase domain-containing protein n=1 Tax=Curvularia kusanoi TaxID=90978 RepID=A0A9P4TP43_CURKU|nr:hypothetical protein E8E13_011285 [Curvularia kusanoi]
MRPTIVDLGFEDEGSSESSIEISEDPEPELSDDVSDVEDELELKTELRDCLDDVAHEGSYSAFKRYESFPNPGIFVENLGVVGLPLSDRDAKAIAALCKRSPFGRGDETVVDESVRKTWELEASQIEFRNPAWAAFEQTLVRQATTDLGVQIEASAQPYKLLLYEEGAFFKAHRDTEKAPGMFGTLVVCLPSEHTGGEVLLKHDEKRQTLHTAGTSAHEISALAWYSDVQHEIKPVMSGYRLVMTYNLTQDQTLPRQSAQGQDANHQRLGNLLRTWNKHFDFRDHYIYPLSFKYTEESLCQSNLKGEDAAKGRYLDQVCVHEEVYWFLGHTVKQKEEDDDDYGWVEGDSDYDEHSFKWTTVPDGRRIQLGLSYVDEVALLIDEDHYDRDPDSEDEGEYTGNENMPSTLRYHDSVIVLMLKKAVLAKFKAATLHPPESLSSYFDLIRTDPNVDPSLLRDALHAILEKSIALMKESKTHIPKRSYLPGFYVERQRKEQQWKHGKYVEVAEAVADFCYLKGFSDIVGQLVRAAVNDGDWTASPELVIKQVKFELDNGGADAWDRWHVLGPNSLEQKLTILEIGFLQISLPRLPTSADNVPSFEEWKSARIHDLIGSVSVCSQGDAEALVRIIPKVAPQTYMDCIIPTLANCTDAAGFSRFLFLLQIATTDKVSREHIAKPTFERLAQTANTLLQQPLKEIMPPPHVLPQGSDKSQWFELIAIVGCYMDLGLEQAGAQLLSSSLPDVPDATDSLWEHWQSSNRLITTLAELLTPYVHTGLPEKATPFITSLLHTIAAYYASSRPSEPATWAQGNVRGRRYGYSKHGSSDRDKGEDGRCNCGPCQGLQKFLENPTQRVGRFSYAKETRRHLESQIDSYDFEVKTEKGKSPHTLVLTKTHNRSRRELSEWKSTIAKLRQQFQAFDLLLQPIGISATDAADLDAQLIAAGSSDGVLQAGGPLKSLSSGKQNSAARGRVAGVKRKSDVIDLTED